MRSHPAWLASAHHRDAVVAGGCVAGGSQDDARRAELAAVAIGVTATIVGYKVAGIVGAIVAPIAVTGVLVAYVYARLPGT